MPELPEVEHLRRTLKKRIVGKIITGVDIRRRDVVITTRDPQGGFSRSRSGDAPARLLKRELLVGCRVSSLGRRGKQLAIVGENGALICVHLGMTGQVVVCRDDVGAHAHVVWTFDDGTRMAFRDARRFGGLWLYPHEDALEEMRWHKLGPDALNVDGDQLRTALRSSSRAIKAALLDQHAVAGVGNIYADEALFRAHVRPTRRCARVRAHEFDCIAAHVRAVLSDAITRGGSSIRDYVDADGRAGTSQLTHAVYGRGGEACVVCGESLRSAQVAQRTTVWCAHCQR